MVCSTVLIGCQAHFKPFTNTNFLSSHYNPMRHEEANNFPTLRTSKGQAQGTQSRQFGSGVYPLATQLCYKGRVMGQGKPSLCNCLDGVKGQGGGAGESDRRGQRPVILHSAAVFVKDIWPHHFPSKACPCLSIILSSFPAPPISYHLYSFPIAVFHLYHCLTNPFLYISSLLFCLNAFI